jgi:hypothetical protein
MAFPLSAIISALWLPWYQRPIPLLMGATVGALEAQSELGDSINAINIREHITNQNRPPSLLDRLLRWLVGGKPHLLDQEPYDAWQGMYAVTDTAFVMVAAVAKKYTSWLGSRSWAAGDLDTRTKHLNVWTPADASLPVFRSNVDLLEYAINNIDPLDILHATARSDVFEVRTAFLDDCQRKDPATHVGATVALEARSSTSLVITSMTYDGNEYGKRDKIPEHAAHAVLLGMMAYMTVASHAFHSHYQSSARVAALSQSMLPMSHPVRQILMPTELGTTSVIARAVHTLLGEDGNFVRCFPFTYKGLRAMLRDYTDRPVPTDFKFPGHRVAADYSVWWTHIAKNMSDVVNALYPPTTLLDPVVKAWLTAVDGHGRPTDDRAALIRALASVFMIQVRHNFLSNHIVSHIFRYTYILDPTEVLVAPARAALAMNQATKLRWVPITRDFSPNIDHSEARAVMRAFYQGLKDIPVSHALSKPHEIEASTGM